MTTGVILKKKKGKKQKVFYSVNLDKTQNELS